MSREKEIEDKNAAQTHAQVEQMRLSAPWGGTQTFIPPAPTKEAAEAMQNAMTSMQFMQMRGRLHEVYIVEREKTRRLGLVISSILVLAGAGIVTFAPEGREVMSNWLGAALLVSAAGSVGFASIRGKSPILEVSASGKGDS